MMDPPKHSDLVRELKELSWSDVKQMAIHLHERIDLALLTDIEERPIGERLPYTMKAWLERDCEASWTKVVSALRVIEKNVLACEIDAKYCVVVVKAKKPSTMNPPNPGLESGPASVVSFPAHLALNPTPLHQPQPENETISTSSSQAIETTTSSLESASITQDVCSDSGRAIQEQELSDHYPVTSFSGILRPLGLLSRSEKQLISYIAVMAAIFGAVIAAAGSGEYLIVADAGFTAAVTASMVKIGIVCGVPEYLRKLAVFAAGASLVVIVLVGAVSARTADITVTGTTAATPILIQGAVVPVTLIHNVPLGLAAIGIFGEMIRRIPRAILVVTLVGVGAVGIIVYGGVYSVQSVYAGSETLKNIEAATKGITALIIVLRLPQHLQQYRGTEYNRSCTAACIPVCTQVLLLIVAAATDVATAQAVGTVAGVAAGVMGVAAAGSAVGASHEAAAAAAARAAAAVVVAVAITVVTAAVGTPVLTTVVVGLSAIVALLLAMAIAVTASAAATPAAGVAVGTIVVAVTAMTAALSVVIPPTSIAAVGAAVTITAALGVELSFILHRHLQRT